MLSRIRQYLAERKARSDFLQAVQRGKLEVVQQMVDDGFDYQGTRFADSPLTIALASEFRQPGGYAVFRYLKELQWPVENRDHPDLLAAACEKRWMELVRELVELGWDIHHRGGFFATPLELAVRGRNEELFDFLVEHGATKDDYTDSTWYRVNGPMVKRLHAIGVEIPSHILADAEAGRWG